MIEGMAGILDRAQELTDALGAELQDVRIRLAQERDSLLTEAEMIAMLDVYEEFGR